MRDSLYSQATFSLIAPGMVQALRMGRQGRAGGAQIVCKTMRVRLL